MCLSPTRHLNGITWRSVHTFLFGGKSCRMRIIVKILNIGNIPIHGGELTLESGEAAEEASKQGFVSKKSDFVGDFKESRLHCTPFFSCSLVCVQIFSLSLAMEFLSAHGWWCSSLLVSRRRNLFLCLSY